MNINEKSEGQNDLLSLLPKKVRESSELTKSAKLVLADIILLCGTDYANENGCCYRSNEDLMKDTHIKSRETLSTCLAKLCTMNYITREAGVRGQASTYCINHKMLEIEKPTQGGDTDVTTDKNVTKNDDNLLAEIRLLRQEISELKGTITSILGYGFKEKGYDLGYGSNKIGYGLGYDSDKIRYDLGVKNAEKGYDRTENRTTDTDKDTDKEIITKSVSSYTVNDSVVKNETTVTSTTDESKKIYEWVKETLDKGKRLLSNYRDSHTREEADESWSKITELTSLMNKAIGKNKLTEKQCEMLQEFIAKASRTNEGKEKYLSKVSGNNSVAYETTAGTTITSSESSSYHPDGNGYCNGKFIECEFGLRKNEASGKLEMTNKSVGEMLYKLHKLSGKEKSDYQLHVNELVKAYCVGNTTPENAYKHLTAILAKEGEKGFFSVLKEMTVEIEEDVEAPEIETPNEDNVTSETVTEPSQNEERAYGEDDFDHFTYTEEKTSLRDNSRRLDFDNPPF